MRQKNPAVRHRIARRFIKLEKTEISEILEFMKIVYQGRKIDDSDATVETWSIMFEDYSKIEVMRAIRKLATKNKFVPSVHEILDNIEDTFTVEKMQKRNLIIIRVKYRDEVIPFKFTTKESAMEVVDYLKSQPCRADIFLLYEKNAREMNFFTKTTFVNQDQREEFDIRKKNEYYAQRMKNQ